MLFYCGARTAGSSGFADGRHEVSLDSEQIEPAEAKPLWRNSVSVEQIQDSPPEEPFIKRSRKASFFMLLLFYNQILCKIKLVGYIGSKYDKHS